MIVVEGNSQRHPGSTMDLSGYLVITTKTPTENTDYQCVRDITRWDERYPVLCYKWNRGKEVWTADHKRWDALFRSFEPSHPDPSSGCCAVFCAFERFLPDRIGVIGLDYMLDGGDWIHDSRAELAAIRSVVDIVDLRSNTFICRF